MKNFGDPVIYVRNGEPLHALVAWPNDNNALTLLFLDPIKNHGKGSQVVNMASTAFHVPPLEEGAVTGWKEAPEGSSPFDGMGELGTTTGLMIGKYDHESGFLFKPADPARAADVFAAFQAGNLARQLATEIENCGRLQAKLAAQSAPEAVPAEANLNTANANDSSNAVSPDVGDFSNPAVNENAPANPEEYSGEEPKAETVTAE